MKNMNTTEKNYDIAIIGGGASGLAAAIALKRKNKGLKTAVLEAQPRVGRKLLSTGNGRCNLTNLNIQRQNYIGSFNPEKILKKYPPERLMEFFSSIGLVCSAEPGGLVYPLCRQASAVLNVLLAELERLGVEIICGCKVTSLKKSRGGFIIGCGKESFSAKSVAAAFGGKASPSLGSSDSGLEFLRLLGHKIITPYPCLTPIEVKSDAIRSLKGIRAKAEATLLDGEKIIKSENGEVQFSEKALSGICIFNLSSRLGGLKRPVISLNLLPNYSKNEIYAMLRSRRNIFADNKLDGFFTGMFQKMIGAAVLKAAGLKDFSRKCSSLSDEELKRLGESVSSLSFDCVKPESFAKAQVMAGGAFGAEVDGETLESKIVKGLYICGEALDICGDCGGFNLHFAFSSGLMLGENYDKNK